MKIIYTHTDEAPALATYSLLPIVQAFAAAADVDVELRDISLAGRILAQFPDSLTPEQRVPDVLAELGELAKTPEANIIKLPNVSASLPQIKAAIAELQSQGYAIPDYPADPADPARAKYDAVKGSAVNPVLREGNSDRRAPASVKAFARKHPHRMGAWSKDCESHVSTMSGGDFRSTEKSVTVADDGAVRIEHVAADGTITVLKERIPVLAGEVLDAAVMRRAALDAFLAEQVAEAKQQGVLFSVHLKATMMKVSDPIIFGHAVRAVVGEVYDAARREPQRRPRQPPRRTPRGPRSRRRRADGRPVDRDGRLRQGHHEPPRALGRHRRRLDARRHPLVGADVERGRRASGHEVRHPGLLVRGAVRRDRRPLPRARRVRSGDDGDDAERRAHGAEGGGVRLARQDVRAGLRRHGPGRRRGRARR